MRERIQNFLARLARIREYRALPFVATLAAGFFALSLAAHLPALLQFDRAVTHGIQTVRNPFFDRLAVAFTFLGNTTTLIAIGACVILAFWASAKPKTGLLCAAILLALPLNMLIKELVGRPRPTGDFADILLPAVGLSYPSGHAMASVAFYGFLGLLSWIHIQRRTVRNFMAMAFALVAVSVSLSRIYVGAHWFSDVMGGTTAGILLIFAFELIYRWIGTAERAPQPKLQTTANLQPE